MVKTTMCNGQIHYKWPVSSIFHGYISLPKGKWMLSFIFVPNIPRMQNIKKRRGANAPPHLSLGGVVLHQRVVGEGVAANHRAAGARHSIQRLFLGGRGLASTGWKFG